MRFFMNPRYFKSLSYKLYFMFPIAHALWFYSLPYGCHGVVDTYAIACGVVVILRV